MVWGFYIASENYSTLLNYNITEGYKLLKNEFKIYLSNDKMVAYEFIKGYNFKEHIGKLSSIYKIKSEFAMDNFDRYYSHKITYNKVFGEMFIWCTLVNGNMLDFCSSEKCFLVDEKQNYNSFKINFFVPSVEQLEIGIKALGTI